MLPATDPTPLLRQQLHVLETVPDSYIVVSPELIILTASDAYLADTLKRRDELVGRYLFDAFPDNPAAPEANAVRNWRASLELVMATGQPHQMALQHYDVLDPDRPGHFVERYWLPRNTPVFDAQGKLCYIIHSSVNVTKEVLARQAMVQAQDQVHEALREAGRERWRLNQLILQAPAAICLLQGPNFIYELVNPVYQRLFAGQALLGKPLGEAVPELQNSPIWAHLQQVYCTGQTHHAQELPITVARTPEGGAETRYFNHTLQARYDEHQQVDGVYVFAFEVTEQVRARQQVLDLNQQLTRTNADLDTFVYTASHDLRVPIANLEGLVDALRQELLTLTPNEPTLEQILGLMRSSIARFQTTLGDLTTIMQVQQDGRQAQPELLDVAALLNDVCLDLAATISQAQAQVRVDVADCPTLHFSRKNLRSIVFNLLSNALKYRAPGRPAEILVRLHCTEQAAELQVQDNGLGLSEQQQQKLFHLFERVHTHVEGSGVGLYTVKKIVDNAQGLITVSSELGVGSTFTVRLPL